MAIDTAAKRFSIMDADLPTQPGMVPPDGTIDVGARLALLWLYSGIVPEWTAELVATIPNFTSGLDGAYGPTAELAATMPNFTSQLDGIGGEETNQGGSYAPQYAKGERRKRGLEWDRPEGIEDRLQRVYDRLHGDLAEVAEPSEVREAVAEHATASDAAIPPPAAIDFQAMAQDAAAVTALLVAYEKALEAKAEADDEEDAVIALLLA